MFTLSVIFNSRDLETAQVPISRWVDKKLWYIYTMEFCTAVKKKELLPFATARMDLENTMLSEVSQSEKDKYHIWSHSCGNEKNKMMNKIKPEA